MSVRLRPRISRAVMEAAEAADQVIGPRSTSSSETRVPTLYLDGRVDGEATA